MLHVVFYEPVADVLTHAAEHFPAHGAWVDEFAARGELLMVGTFEDPQRDGSMSVFRTRAAADEFVAGDPFVRNGVVARVEVRGWNEVLTAAPSA